ncbi:MAG: hypothetical protein PHR77_15940 [Kiritimatiellae bacterium]|nr:hypothetical protein [Kiritimatiellia bacterium]MDD5520652.1 hypothetical protein [Kiritimatiellia bacterium]
MTRKQFLITILVLCAVAGLALWNHGRNSGWWGTSDAQRTLLTDAMAARDLDGLTLVRSEESQPVGVGGKSPGAYVFHWFTPRGDAATEVETLGRLATEAGWVRDATRSHGTTWLGTRRTPSGEATLVIAVEGADRPAVAEGMEGKVRVFLTL